MKWIKQWVISPFSHPCSPNLTPFSYQAEGRALAPSSSSSYNLRSQGPAELGAEVLDTCALKGDPIRFRRWLHNEIRNEWEKIWEDASKFQLEEHEDIVVWSLGKNNKFTVKSVYNGLTKNDCGFSHKRIWKGKIPAKIKIFLWLLSCNALLTKDNLQKRKWMGDPSCAFCDCLESISHLFSSVLWPVWFGLLLLNVLAQITFQLI